MGLFSKLFGGSKTPEVKQAEPVEYEGFKIYQEARAEGVQFRIAGRITKAYPDGEVKEHVFIRSDLLSTEHDANEFMLKKAQMFIDQMGDEIF